jgi:hypothetical protein
MLKAQHGILIIFCTFIIICFILVFFPPQSAMAVTITPDVTSPTKLVNEQTVKDITGAAKRVINGPALAQVKREMAKDGWKASGNAFYRNGKWLLKFSRTIATYEGAFAGVLLPDMYWDDLAKCLKYKANNQPAANMPCNEKS